MRTSPLQFLWRSFTQSIARVGRAGLIGLTLGAGLVESLALALNHHPGARMDIAWAWPPVTGWGSLTPFVHVTAVGAGLLLAALLALVVTVKLAVQGVVYAAEHAGEMAGAVVDQGLDVVDAFVDVVDGPNRHGFRGKRGPQAVTPKTGTMPIVVPPDAAQHAPVLTQPQVSATNDVHTYFG